MPDAHQYGDRFLTRELFEWKSQNRHTLAGKPGQAMRNHREQGTPVRLFVRKKGKLGGSKAAPFVYVGEVDFVDWEGEKPITIRWKLRTELSPTLWEMLGDS